MLDSNDWPVSFLGCLYAGVVPVAVNTLLTADDYAYMLDAQPRAGRAGVGRAAAGAAGRRWRRAPHEVRTAVRVAARPATLPAGALELRRRHRGGTRRWPRPPPPRRKTTRFWLYSSGSTGRPKGTVHTHANP